jgi:hypothetical protein
MCEYNNFVFNFYFIEYNLTTKTNNQKYHFVQLELFGN